MPKLGPIYFDDPILDALRDDRLVIFAGAGVSKGPPSNLPSFFELANEIAAGTGLALAENEPIDRFLGRLAHKSVDVHSRAARHLTPAGSAPNTLHTDLLRLFRSAERVRLVTTNFDLHFETASESLFAKCSEVFRAPALPLGHGFRGIVHAHGALTHPHEMVLTDVDFGRAYLTEGWARRFLADVFRTYTVLFVGYSHNDVVINYLARALPAGGVAGRYALTEEDGDWEWLGITPIRFQKGADADAFKELYDGVRCLAERSTRGALDWQTRLAEIGSGVPPADEEAIGEIEQALREVHTTRFFVQVARDIGWPKWLNARKQLDALFDSAPLSERDRLLAWWLAENYAIEHADECFELIAAHGMRLHPDFWLAISRELGLDDKKTLQDAVLTPWVTVLIACAPVGVDDGALMWLAERCAKRGAVVPTLEVFLFMGTHRFGIKPGFVWPSDDGEHDNRFDVQTPLNAEHWGLNEVWTEQLKPSLGAIVQPLLSGIVRRLENIHHGLLAWGKASRDGDASTWGRAAIEPHEQDAYPEAIDVLIDAARDALDWLGANRSILLEAWVERLIGSDVPLLRRLAIHGTSVHPGKSDDDKLSWLLSRVGLHQPAEHHETHRLAALAYPAANSAVRRAVIDAVLLFQWPDASDEHAADRTMRKHFNWLDWLQSADSSCPLLEAALAPIKTAHPQWEANEYPDLTHWGSTSVGGLESPWTVEQLLAKTPSEQLDDFLNFKGNPFDGPDRDGLIAAVKEACKQRFAWALQLDEALTERSLWTSDLWPSVLRGWHDAELTRDEWNTVLQRIARREVHTERPQDVASLLYLLVRDGGKPFVLDLLDNANDIAIEVRRTIKQEDTVEEINDWLSRAINRPAGVLVEFWINGLSLLMRGKSGAERMLPDEYRDWFTAVVQDETVVGGLGRSLLASQTAFLFGLDEGWTREHIIPLFSEHDRQKFAQAWDGFLAWGRLSPPLAEALQPGFLAALPRLGADLADRRRRFIEFFTLLAVFHVEDPTQQLLPTLFEHGTVEDRIGFAAQLDFFLRQMRADTKQQLWDRWLRHYWLDRLQSVPAPLTEAEARKMLEWLAHIGDAFPVAVQLATGGAPVALEHTHLLRELRDSGLVTRFQAATAQLLIFICGSNVPHYFCSDMQVIAGRLTADVLGDELHRSLQEAMAYAGCNNAS